MSDSHLLIRTRASRLGGLAAELAEYLPGLDVHLTPISRTQALLAAHLVRALRSEYGPRASEVLAKLEVESVRWVDESEAMVLVESRDPKDLPERTGPAVPRDWHLQTIRAPQAWALLGGAGHIDWGSTRVAHIDTGYTRHPAFGFPGQSWVDVANAQTFLPPLPNGRIPFPSHEPGAGLDPLTGAFAGHGTRIGATICGHDPGASFNGVAPKVPLLPIRITDSVVINHAQDEFLMAVQHGVAWGAEVFSVSLGLFPNTPTPALKKALNLAYEAGALMICAAGQVVHTVRAPAAMGRSIAVAGTAIDDKPWSDTAHGATVDHSAPATDLHRANVKKGKPFGYADRGDGTSYATAMTSGAAALWLTARRADINALYPQPWQRPAAFRELMKRTARVPAAWNAQHFGAGILDVERLLTEALPDPAQLVREPAL